MPVEFKDYYEVLGVPRNAGGESIKAFRNLARQHHPDAAKYKREAEEKFKGLNDLLHTQQQALSRALPADDPIHSSRQFDQ